ncbi:MAG: hypothetical protein IT381_12240 [Deltaproteobacteria bacterium]|nr:hypothetical protein [Deltaproteobacteria bacterium]
MAPKPPSNAPPPSAPPAKKAAEKEDWDDMLGEEQQSGISPEMARTLLSMNPKLREEGKNTAWVVSSGQKAAHQGSQKQKAAAAAPAAKPAAAGDVFSELDTLKRKLELDEQQFDLQLQQIQVEKARAKQSTLEDFMRVLINKDPELLSPMTQQALADKKAFLDKLGFSVKAFVEFKRKHGTK